jgi:hypothetical protein
MIQNGNALTEEEEDSRDVKRSLFLFKFQRQTLTSAQVLPLDEMRGGASPNVSFCLVFVTSNGTTVIAKSVAFGAFPLNRLGDAMPINIRRRIAPSMVEIHPNVMQDLAWSWQFSLETA